MDLFHKRRSNSCIYKKIVDLSLLAPFVLLSDLLFLFRSKVVLNVEGLSNFLWGLSLNHICYSLASEVQEWFNIQIVGRLRISMSDYKSSSQSSTKISSKSVAWSTLQKSWSHGMISSVLFSSFFSSETGVGCSKWYYKFLRKTNFEGRILGKYLAVLNYFL